nr:glycosyl hydrolase family 18 protein [Candidatus Sigynarchaeota archaeon]
MRTDPTRRDNVKGEFHPTTCKVVAWICIVAGAAVAPIGIGIYGYYNPWFTEQRTPKHFFWISGLFTADAFQILQLHPDKIDMVSPAWYTLSANGTIESSMGNASETIALMENVTRFCNENGISIHPLVGCGSETALRNLLEHQGTVQQFTNSTVDLLTTSGYDGINIDFEGVPCDLRDEFISFFDALKHALPANKNLSIDVPALESDQQAGWGGWCDYRVLGGIADMFMIMTYDAHGGWSEPGEVAPTSWVQRVLAYAVRAVSLERIYVGIPRYGYDWSDDPGWQNWGFGHAFFMDRHEAFGGTMARTTDGKELLFRYTDAGGFNHTAYFCDVETTRAKQAFLARYPVGGYCYWHLSSGDPRFFE